MRSTAVSLISSVFSVSVASLFCESAGANCNLTRLLDKLNSAKVSGASAAASTSSAAADFSGPEKRAIVGYWKSHSKLAAGLCLLAGLLTAGAVAARDHEDALALGDSVVFGFITQAGFEYVNPDNFIGYPEYLNVFDDVDFTNAACPGETTGSFLSSTAPDNGCRNFRSLAPLHVAYGSTQFNFAKDFLSHHRDVRLVTIGLGANDLFLLTGFVPPPRNLSDEPEETSLHTGPRYHQRNSKAKHAARFGLARCGIPFSRKRHS